MRHSSSSTCHFSLLRAKLGFMRISCSLGTQRRRTNQQEREQWTRFPETFHFGRRNGMTAATSSVVASWPHWKGGRCWELPIWSHTNSNNSRRVGGLGLEPQTQNKDDEKRTAHSPLTRNVWQTPETWPCGKWSGVQHVCRGIMVLLLCCQQRNFSKPAGNISEWNWMARCGTLSISVHELFLCVFGQFFFFAASVANGLRTPIFTFKNTSFHAPKDGRHIKR